jgi:HAE1 family hydrophobic/amphiphilic exporter-1
MGLTRLSLRRPLTMLMIILALVVIGYRGYTELQLDRFPRVEFPYVTVVTIFPGASPEDIEDLVVKPIEDAVSTISGIDTISSQATEGAGIVVIAFLEGVDANQAAIEVERQVATVRGQLPAEAQDPTVVKADFNAIPILIMTLDGPQSQEALYELADQDLKPRFQTVSGVASVSISGGREREIQVYVDPVKLAAYNLPISAVQQALAANNVTFPAGSLEAGRSKTTVRSVGEFTNLDDIRNIVIVDQTRPAQGGQQQPSAPKFGKVYLRDIARVEEGLKDQDNILRYNGREAISISVIKSSDSNTVEVADNLRRVVEELNAELPAGAKLTVIDDTSKFIRESVNAVLEDLVLAVLITGLVMLVFLHTIRSTFIVMLAIPTSLISTFLVMWMLGFSLNMLTLLAMTLVIGILVDDSIVVLENIERHISRLKKPPMQAALEGRREIGLAAITITLVDVVIYVPVAFMSGIVGQFFYSYGVTIAAVTLFSLFVAFTLTPMLAGFWMKDESKPKAEARGLGKIVGMALKPVEWLWNGFTNLWEKGFTLLTELYGLTLRFFLWNFATQILAVVIAVVALAGGIYLVINRTVGTEFFPQEDDGKVSISIEMPPGTNLQTTDRVARQIEGIVLNKVPEVTSILTNVGGGGGLAFFGGSTQSNQASINLSLVPAAERSRNTVEVIEALRPFVEKIPEAQVSLSLTSMMGMGGGNMGAIQVQVYGPEPDKLIDLSNQVEVVMKSVPGTADIKNTGAARAPEAQLVVNRDRAEKLGLSPYQVASILRTALSGSQVGNYKPTGDTEIDITLRLAPESRHDLNQLLDTPLTYLNNQPILVNRVVEVEESLAPAQISRSDRQRVLSINSGLSLGAAAGDVTDDIEAALRQKVQFPVGYGFRFVGQSEILRETFSQFYMAILLSIILIYMLLVALYQSWLQPLAIMLSLPVTLVGALGGLWITHNTLNMISMLGVVLLTGIVTKNAILVVDFTNLLRREQGYECKAALVQAGKMRLRAVLMTSLVLVFALIPLLFGAGAGAEIRAPLAAVVIGGSISSTLLTLILVPVVYNFFDWGGGLAARAFRAIFGLAEPEEEAPAEEKAPEPFPPSPRPAPQPGSAISLKPSATKSDPEAA